MAVLAVLVLGGLLAGAALILRLLARAPARRSGATGLGRVREQSGPAGRRRRFRRLPVVLAATAGVVVVVLVLAVVSQRALIYRPDRTPVGTVRDRVDGGRDVVLHTEDGLDLDAWWVPPTAADRQMAVLYCPGNGGSRLGRLPVAIAIAAEGFSVLLVDYRGYGGNPGAPSEDGFARDARAAVEVLRDEGFDAAHTLYVGESIGTGVVARLVTTDPPAGVLLRSPFTSLADVVTQRVPFLPVDLLLRDRFTSAEYLAASDVPVRVLYGDADEVIAPHLSTELAARVPTLNGLVVVPGAAHNDEVWFGPSLAKQVAALADAVGAD